MSTAVEISDAEVADVLEKALATMNDSGAHWIQGSYTTGYGPHARYCSVGAINQTLGFYNADVIPLDVFSRKERLHRCATKALAQTIQERGLLGDKEPSPIGKGYVIDWNDSHGRTWDQIVDVFTATIKRLRGAP